MLVQVKFTELFHAIKKAEKIKAKELGALKYTNFKFTSEYIEVANTDGNRLTLTKLPYVESVVASDLKVLLDTTMLFKQLSIVDKSLDKKIKVDALVGIEISDKVATFKIGGFQDILVLIETDRIFPAYEGLIPLYKDTEYPDMHNTNISLSFNKKYLKELLDTTDGDIITMFINPENTMASDEIASAIPIVNKQSPNEYALLMPVILGAKK